MGLDQPQVVQGDRQHRYRLGSRAGEIKEYPALAWRILSLSQSPASLRMLILAQCAKLFAGELRTGSQSQPFRADSDPLTGTNFPGGVIIVLRQVLDEVTLGTSQILMGDGAEHTMGR